MLDMLDIFGHEEDKTHLIVDISGYLHQKFYTAEKDEKFTDNESTFNYWRYLILTELAILHKKYNPNNVFICCDRNSWRSDHFEYYKAKRKAKRNEHPEKFEELFKQASLFEEELETVFKYNILQCKGAEGDDGVGFLVHELPKEDTKIIVSMDKDMVQLLSIPNTIFFNIHHLKKCEEYCENPEIALQKLIINGDSSDGIPNMKSDSDTFVNEEKRQKSCGEKTIEKMFIAGFDEILKENVTWRKNYKRNEKLIVLDEKNIPVKVWNGLKKCFDGFTYSNCKAIELGTYFNNHDIMGLMEVVNNFIRNN